MPRWLRIALVVVVLLIVAIGGAYWWYLGDGNPPANLPAYTFDIAAVRAKAEELPGGKASDIRVETVATASRIDFSVHVRLLADAAAEILAHDRERAAAAMDRIGALATPAGAAS